MKDFLMYVKNLETDFDLSDRSYRSKIELGVTSLITSDYEKAKEMFDGAIEMDSDMPAGWIGKCFSEIALVSDDDFNNLMLDEYINRALRKTDELVNYRVALCGCLIYRHDQLIRKYFSLKAKAKNAAQNAANNTNLAIGAAGLGIALSGNRRSVSSNIVGGALITGGISSAIIQNANMNYFINAGNEYDYLLMYQCLMSSPIVKFSDMLIEKSENKSLIKILSDANVEWNQTIKLVLKDEVINFVDYVYDMNISNLITLRRENTAVPIKRLMLLQSIIKGEDCEENLELEAIIKQELASENMTKNKNLDFQDEGIFMSYFFKILGFGFVFIGIILFLSGTFAAAFLFTILGSIMLILHFKEQNPNSLRKIQQKLKEYIKKHYASSQQSDQITSYYNRPYNY